MSSDPGPYTGAIIVLVILIMVNGFFAASEMAIVSANKNRIRTLAQDGNKRAIALSGLMEEPNKFLSAIQVAITLAGFLTSAIAAMDFSGDVGIWLTGLGIPHGQTVATVLLTVGMSIIVLIFGELFPKRLAMLHAEGMAMAICGPIKFVSNLFKPVVALLSISVNILLRLFRQRTDVTDVEYSEDDVVCLIEAGKEQGELNEEGTNMIKSIFAFDDILAYEIMTPRTDVFSININDPHEEYIDELMELRYSRIPVYDDDSDNIIGILNIKDYLIKARTDGFDQVDIKPILREPYFVPETKNIDTLFVELQKTKQHIAILIDEYGGFCGIVTMEDIIEEVMGDIADEYDEVEQEITKIGHKMYIIEGSMNLDDLDEELGIDLESEDSETISGFIIDMLGEIPDDDDIGKEIFYENYVFTIKSVKDRRIEQVALKILPPVEKEEE